MKAVAPGKLILSGEHAVVYGKPALVTAIDRNVQAEISVGSGDRVAFNLPDMAASESYTLRTLRDAKQRILNNYRNFLSGDMGIREVLHKPLDLVEFAFITLLDGLHLKLGDGLNIALQSNIPMGCGMGSSAAAILSVLRGVGHYFRVEFRPDWYLKYGIEAENMQHGHSSGVDPYIALHGGCARFQDGKAESRPLPRLPMYLAHTGAPEATTGECVADVKARYAKSRIWDEFEALTSGIEQALLANDLDLLRPLIRANQRLLETLGVVPGRVAQFVRELEAQGVAAKITGAGSVSGDAAGMVLMFAEHPPVELCAKYGYPMINVRGEPLGARIV